eukprot:768670-Hanusia_phi.AAC.3
MARRSNNMDSDHLESQAPKIGPGVRYLVRYGALYSQQLLHYILHPYSTSSYGCWSSAYYSNHLKPPRLLRWLRGYAHFRAKSFCCVPPPCCKHVRKRLPPVAADNRGVSPCWQARGVGS